MKFTLNLMTVSFLSITAVAAHATDTENHEFQTEGLKELHVMNISGTVQVQPTDGQAKVVAEKKKFSPSICTLTVERAGATLIAKVEKNGMTFVEDCRVDLRIEIPKSVAVDVKAASSTVSLKGLEGAVSTHTASGEVSYEGILKKGEFHTASGDIKLKLSRLPDAGGIDIHSASGDAILMVPKGSKLHASLRSASGDLANQVGDDPGSRFHVSMKSASGDLAVKAY